VTLLAVTLAMLAGPPVDVTATPHRTMPGTVESVCDARCRHPRWYRVVRPVRGYLNRIAQCESGRRWHIATGNGYYGGLQFAARSWWAVGGQGLPHWASRLEQKYRAVLLSRLQGWGAWPVCSHV
jgi:hypothetical protein